MVILGLITLIVALVQIVNFGRLCRYVDRALSLTGDNYSPKAAVILPCKGLDPGFKQNVLKLLKQDYGKSNGSNAGFEVIFAVAQESDPAYAVLQEVAQSVCSDAGRSTNLGPVRVVVAGTHPERAQKLNNQLCALKEVSSDVEVLVFVDSDVIARTDFLHHLVSPLSDPAIGATTGYRFYVSEQGGWWALLRALWNRMTAWEMASPKFAFAWGGAMAIRKEVFEKANVAQAWDKAADDDLSLTCAVKKLGLKIHFVPQCLVASAGDAGFDEIFEWTNRQLILTKIYYPRLWLRAIERALIMVVWLITMIAACFLSFATGSHQYLFACLLGALIIPIELWFLVKAQSLWVRVLPDQADYLASSFAKFCLAVPLAHLILPWMTLYSLVTNRIKWRGVTYELISPSETRVVATTLQP